MVGILIATHGQFAEGILNAAELLAGKQENIASMGLFHGDSIDGFESTMESHIKDLDQGAGVLVLVDITGGSPSNTALKCMRMENNIQAITNINLPMLVEILMARDNSTIEELVNIGVEVGEVAPSLLHEEFKLMNLEDDDNDDF